MRVIMKPLRRTLVFFIFSVFLCGTVSARQIEWQSCMTSPYSDWFGKESSSPELLCGYLSVPLNIPTQVRMCQMKIYHLSDWR